MECINWLCWVVSAVGLLLLYKLLDTIFRWPTVGNYSDRYILVTGCDSGFGNEISRRLDSLGCHVFAGCLTEKGEIELRKVCSDRLQTLSMDVTNQQSVRKAYEFVTSKLPAGTGLWGVLNNAGIAGRCGPPEWLSIKDYEQVLNVNLLGLIDVTMTFLPLVKQSRGRIVNTSSMLGRFTLDSCIPYCVSKYGIEAFTDGLRRTLRPYNCRAILIEPGFHQTNMISKSNINSLLEEAWNNASPEVKEEFGEEYFRQAYNRLADSYSFMTTHRVSDVVDAYEHALLSRHPRPRYVVGIDAWFLGIPGQSLPEWISDWLVNILDRSKSVPAILLNTTRQ